MGNRAGEGSGETRPRTEPEREDRGTPSASRVAAGSGAAGENGDLVTGRRPEREPLPTRIEGLPPLPDDYRAVLSAGLAQIGTAGLVLDDEQLAAIDGHVRLLLAWNDAINLTAVRVPDAIAREHVLDSLTALPLLRHAGIAEFIDYGSGGGYPGLPLAVALPAKRALLVESVGKKARFLEAAAVATGLSERVEVAPLRLESLARDNRHRGRWPAVVVRAVADLSELAELSLPVLRVGGLLVAWKRWPFEEELEASRLPLHRLGGRLVDVEAVTVTGLEDHVLVVIEKTSPTHPEYPRNPAVRRRLHL
jgi:16S rRNA (guanine527-N7)-methyltransferase